MAEQTPRSSGGWKKHFKIANVSNMSPISGNTNVTSIADPGYRNYQSQLPEVYIGHPNRIERYGQYEQMDQDTEVNGALDILAEFCTQVNPENNTTFTINYKEKPTDSEIKIIKEQLTTWYSLNKMHQRMFKMVRNALKYGDQVFIRDPETFELYWVEMAKVTKVIVNESEGKEPEQYMVKDLGPNFQNLTATAIAAADAYTNNPTTPGGAYGTPRVAQSGSRFSQAQNEAAINAEHIVHLSLTEGLDANWPFGNSVLEMVFKVFKQKELLEDAIIIYRIQRAPERRIFKIDVGNMPSHMAMAFVERVKNEVHQRRIPSINGGGQTMMDATYNPLAINEDYFFPQTADGRGSSVETLAGGQNLGEIDDLRYFTNKLFRGLRIPSSYLPTGPEDGTQTYNNGAVGTALIQEWRFNQYCKRLQRLLIDKLDTEFKMFMRWRGINIDSSLFSLEFNEPQNFAKHHQAELDASAIQSFTSLEQLPYMSKRFLMKRYLGLTEEEMQENDEMWDEERGESAAEHGEASDNTSMRAVGVTPGGIDADLDNLEGAEMPEGGAGPAEAGAPGGPGADLAGGAGAAAGAGAGPGMAA